MRTPTPYPRAAPASHNKRGEEVTDDKLDFAPGRFSGGNNVGASGTVTDCLLLKCFLTEIYIKKMVIHRLCS